MLEFEQMENNWIFTSSETKQGKIMPPSNQEESLKHRNSPEKEVEIIIISNP